MAKLPKRDRETLRAMKSRKKQGKNKSKSLVKKFGDKNLGMIRCFCDGGALIGSKKDQAGTQFQSSDPVFNRGNLVASSCKCVVDSGKRTLKSTKLPPARKLGGVKEVFVDVGDFV